MKFEYEFVCSNCSLIFSKVYEINEQKHPTCPYCLCDKIYRKYNSTPIHFKTNGFYSTDNKK